MTNTLTTLPTLIKGPPPANEPTFDPFRFGLAVRNRSDLFHFENIRRLQR